jgi:hypothetical protein
MVEGGAARDEHKPGPNFAAIRLVAVGVPPCLEKDVVHDVPRFVARADDPAHDRVNPSQVDLV